MSEGVALMNERDLVCTGCGRTVQVYEVPVRWIDPTRYRCGPCQKSGPRTELRSASPKGWLGSVGAVTHERLNQLAIVRSSPEAIGSQVTFGR